MDMGKEDRMVNKEMLVSEFKKYLKFGVIQLLIDISYLFFGFFMALLSTSFVLSLFMKIIGISISKVYFLESQFGGTSGFFILMFIFISIALFHYFLLGMIIGKLYYFLKAKNALVAKMVVFTIYLILASPWN